MEKLSFLLQALDSVMAHLYIFGDSITYGACDEAGGWVQRIREQCDQKTYSDDDHYLMIYNLGVSGDTTEDLLERFESEFQARRSSDPDDEVFFIFAIGVNDTVFLINENRRRVAPETFRSNFKRMLDSARQYSPGISVLGLTPIKQPELDPVPWSPDKAYRKVFVEEFDRVIAELCTQEQIAFVDIYSAFLEQDFKQLLADGLHPNASGHSLIAQLVSNQLKSWKLL